MIDKLEIAIWDYCGENEVLAMRLSNYLYFCFWWTLSGSFKCWLVGHRFKKNNKHYHCVRCDQPMDLIDSPGHLEIRLFERILVFLYSRVFIVEK